LRHAQGRKFARTFGPVFFCVAPRQKKIFARAYFFLEVPERGRYAVPRKGEGEDEERVVNNVLIAWTFSHVSLVGHMQRSGQSDFWFTSLPSLARM
jgi:hypothetical protein